MSKSNFSKKNKISEEIKKLVIEIKKNEEKIISLLSDWDEIEEYGIKE